MALEIQEGQLPAGIRDDPPDNPRDEPPAVDDTEHTGWFNAEYPHSTAAHPYGYFPDGQGNPDFNRPRKRRPHNRAGSLGGVSVATSGRADKTAAVAAAFLSKMNNLVGTSLAMFGLPITGQEIKDTGEVFEGMAYEALQSDPALARRILSAGASSGQAQLLMAYAMLGASVAPTAMMEFKTRRQETDDDE